MSTGRRAGQTRQTTEGVDDPAGAHGRQQRTRAKSLEDGFAEAGIAESLADVSAPAPADVPDLDERERRQAAARKASGPAKTPTEAATPKAPPPDSPPPTDPA